MNNTQLQRTVAQLSQELYREQIKTSSLRGQHLSNEITFLSNEIKRQKNMQKELKSQIENQKANEKKTIIVIE